MRHLGDPLTREQSDAFARYGQDWHDREGMGFLPVVRTSDGAFLGMCGLHRHRWWPDDVEVGWRFARSAWGHGYATEAASAWLDRAFSELGLDEVISVTTTDNARSLAVMRRLGLRFREEAEHEHQGRRLRLVVHAVTAPQWAASGLDGGPPGTG
jgi:RimJ/RimL family protein N-acetyltransferase